MDRHSKISPGLLVMAATHIGCIDDTPLRTLSALRDCELLIFEEDRPARLLLKQAGIHKAYIKYNEHNSSEILDLLRSHLKAGKSAVYVSDQGCPTLADPGRQLLELAYASHAKIQVIPGPSSVTAAISACPFAMQQFTFEGFLPAETEQRVRSLERLAQESKPIILLDTPYRLEKVLSACQNVFDKKRKAFLALDISGNEENFLVGTFANLLAATQGKKLNFVLIIDGTGTKP